MAKSQHGQWLIRIEDIDPPREITGMAEMQLKTLADFGLVPDEPVLYQSERAAFYDAALTKLLREDKAFYCSCSRKQLADQGGIHRRCVTAADPARAAIRLRVADRTIAFTDGVYGSQSQNLAAETGDVVLRRADGFYAYQLAVVVDDAAQSVTHIVRGEDLLSSTARQQQLAILLGYPVPSVLHVPLVTDESGLKLSKQNHASPVDLQNPLQTLQKAWIALGFERLEAQNIPDFWEKATRVWAERLSRANLHGTN